MFNLQALVEVSPRTLHFRHALAAAYKARRTHLPTPPASLGALFDAASAGTSGLLGRTGVRDALGEIRARLFHAQGRDADAQALWHESLAAALFAARIAQIRQSSVGVTFCAGLLHRAGEALALKILARIELEYRLKLDNAGRQDWCSEHGYELLERLVRGWNVPPQIATCALGWQRLSEFEQVAAESAALNLGRVCALELLQPRSCVPGSVETSAEELGLDAESVQAVRDEAGDVRELIRALD